MSLREQQVALLAALAGDGPAHPDWSPERLRATSNALAHKRAHSVGLAWPCLKDMLGDTFQECFQQYAATQHLLPHGPTADGRLFIRWLDGTHALTDAVRWQALGIDLRFVNHANQWRSRRGVYLRTVWLASSRRIGLVWRIPGLASGRWLWRWPLRASQPTAYEPPRSSRHRRKLTRR